MPDSLTHITFNSLDSSQVAIIKHSLDTLTGTLKQVTNKSSGVNWISLWSAIAGGSLVIAGQYFIETFKSKRGKKEQVINILSDLVKEIQTLRNQYTLLAKHRIHDKFWKYSYQNQKNSELEKAERQEHLRSQAEVRKTISDIGGTIADFVGLVAKFELTCGHSGILDEYLDKINSLKTRPVQDYDKNLDYDFIYTQTPHDEKELREEYFENLSVFHQIVNTLKARI